MDYTYKYLQYVTVIVIKIVWKCMCIYTHIETGKHNIYRREEIYASTVLGLSFVGGIQQAAYQQLDTRA